MNKKIKIAVVSSSFPPLSSGGVSSAQYGLFLILKANERFDVKGFTFSDKEKCSNDLSDNIERSGTSNWFIWFVKKILNIFFKFIDKNTISYQTADIFTSSIGSLKAAYKIKKFQPDIIFISDHGAPMLYISPFVKSKYVWMAHHNPMRFINIPIIGDMSKKDAKFATFLEKKCVKKCDYIVSPSAYMNEFIKHSHSVKQNSMVIPNLLDIDFLDSIEPKNFSTQSNEIKIFIPSAGSVIKGEKYIFSIMQFLSHLVKDKKVIFYLSGHISIQLLYELSNSINLNYEILGQQEYRKNIAQMKSCDLMISPTLLENFGMAILEATLSGIPVVAFNVGGNKEIIKDGVNGYLVNYLDLVDFCDKACHLIECPLDNKSVLVNSRKMYSTEKIQNLIIDLVDNLTKGL